MMDPVGLGLVLGLESWLDKPFVPLDGVRPMIMMLLGDRLPSVEPDARRELAFDGPTAAVEGSSKSSERMERDPGVWNAA